ncbi:MAG: TetR/AcrR family transcriptional regulator [Pseudonocardia sp.]|uniref:TetR/AcrR family transcriptional regulator n=1 Tax=unclassified Pseudonocardia TaxID=2619320 RepID=UPI001AD34A07|nr:MULTISPECIES: TetR/AcrR family transcriptional regulator [unclassified Pseudonocardia]MBN9113565.1 TetR/AcrR family transcriptional regulator [Pseudonocardia sp.]
MTGSVPGATKASGGNTVGEPSRRRVGRPREADSEQTRRLILTTAIAAFARSGFRGTTLRELSDAARLTRGTLHHYFATKEVLYAAAFQNAVEGVYDRFNEVLARHDGLNARLRALLDVMIDPSAKNRDQVTMILRGWIDQDSLDISLQVPPIVERTLRRIGDDAVTNGEIQPHDVEFLLATFRSMAWGIVIIELNQQGGRPDNAIEGLSRILDGTLLTRRD